MDRRAIETAPTVVAQAHARNLAKPSTPSSCVAATPSGKVVYVAAAGSDKKGDGSRRSPWGSIGHAIRQVSDGTTILVGPGTYHGRIRLDEQYRTGVVIRAVPPYQARLRHTGTVVTIFNGKGITLEGFDIAHAGPGAKPLVVQIQDTIGEPGGDNAVSRIVLRNNILHDSYNNDILKINNGAKDITIERNVFYNQQGNDEHIDVNSVANVMIRDNIFFNDFAASGRRDDGKTSSYIVIKDSNGKDDSYVGAQNITVRRNVFFNWQGTAGANFVLVGEDGNGYHEAKNVLIENNLMIGNSATAMRAPLGIKGARDVTFRHNTVVGNLPSNAFAFRFNREGSNPANQNIQLYNNIWSDPTGTMTDFSDTPVGETSSFTLDNNLYWNGGKPIPRESSDLINYTSDKKKLIADPKLPPINAVRRPTWNAAAKRFNDGSADSCAAFTRLVRAYALPAANSPVIGAARADQSPGDDILGKRRGKRPSIGAFER